MAWFVLRPVERQKKRGGRWTDTLRMEKLKNKGVTKGKTEDCFGQEELQSASFFQRPKSRDREKKKRFNFMEKRNFVGQNVDAHCPRRCWGFGSAAHTLLSGRERDSRFLRNSL